VHHPGSSSSGGQMSGDAVIVHDYFTQRGGAERVALAIRDQLPGNRIVTSAYDAEHTFPEVADFDISISTLQAAPMLWRDPRLALPFLPRVFDGLRVDGSDVVVCSSTGWAHGVPTRVPKVVYCHNPPRWLYQRDDFLRGQPKGVATALQLLTPRLRRWDTAAARSADRYLVNSNVVRERVRAAYGIEASVLAPPVSIDPTGPQEAAPGLDPGFFLAIGRARGYKNIDVICEAFRELPGERLVVVGGLPPGEWPDRVSALSDVSDAQLRWLYASCEATISVAHEDFGLSPVEGNAMGRPALCLRYGGFLDSLAEGVSGWFVEELTPAAVIAAVGKLRAAPLSRDDILRHAGDYSLEQFGVQLRRHVDEVIASPRPVSGAGA
jgi:glycosyltransferase involved in cell wall biosynthesis